MYSRFILRTLGSFSILFFCNTQNIMGSELNIAAEIGDTTKVKNLLKKGVDTNERDRFGRTPLIYAALNGHEHIINMLLESHADIHAKDHFDQTALIAAVNKGHVNSAKILLKNGANPSAPNGEDMLPIFIAFEREDFEMVDLLLKYGIKINTIDKKDRTVLQKIIESNQVELVRTVLRRGVDERYIVHLAASVGDTTLLKTFLKNKIDINQKDPLGRTPLLFALLYDRTQCAEMLLDHGADLSLVEINTIDERGKTVLQKIIESNDAELVQKILRRGVDERYIAHLAAGVGDTTLLKTFLKNKINVNQRDPLGRTPLLFALLYDRTQCAEMLLDHGADFSLGDEQGKTPLMVAAERRNIENLKLLLHAGASVFAHDKQGLNALEYVTFGNINRHNQDKCIELLKSVTEDRRIR
ncbi:MAG: ankyrin repeat domain-containing protein [Gemmatimonadetes bacterium]|nr:ankyrin repeat domain-containing protein [Gemmatimonadota bacterium]